VGADAVWLPGPAADLVGVAPEDSVYDGTWDVIDAYGVPVRTGFYIQNESPAGSGFGGHRIQTFDFELVPDP